MIDYDLLEKSYEIDYDLIKKYCGQDLSFRLQGAINNLKNPEIKIVNTGMVSSGKSSLYNILTENTENERFPTGAARTTTIADSLHYKNVIYVDTPGIDVKDIDDEIAFGTIMEADIILMVHNIKTGPLTRAESEWLKRIAGAMASPEVCRQRMIFVCTWKDTRENEEGYNDIFDETCKMVFEAVGTEIAAFDVSVLKYQNGIKKDKPILCEKSGIVELRSFLEKRTVEYTDVKHQLARDNYEKVASEVTELLKKKKQEKTTFVSQKKNKVTQKYRSERSAWSGIYSYFTSRRETFDNLVNELRNM